MIKNNKDIPVGAIVTSDKKNTYIVAVDDAGQRGLYTKTGTWFRFDGDGLSFGKNQSGTIDKIQVFDTLPALDALSEALKMQFTGRAPSANLTTVYTREDPRVTEAKAAKATLLSQKSAIDRQMYDLDQFIARNS